MKIRTNSNLVLFVIFLFINTSLTAQDLTNGLVSLWKLDETTGQTANDIFGLNDGTISGALINQTGHIGQSFYFDGDDYVTINDPVLGENAITISAWVKRYQFVQYGSIIADYSYHEYKRNFILGYQGATNSISFYVGNTNAQSVMSNDFPGDNVWVHVVGVFDGLTDRLDLYVNNQKSSATTTISNIGSTQSTYCSIGRYYNNEWKGNIDQVAIWNRALNDSEVSTLYNSGNGLPYSQWGGISPLSGGTISPSSLTINSGQSPGTISNVTSASGGDGTYSYQWQNSTNGSTFSSISGATGTSYAAPTLTQDTWYRRKVTDGSSTIAYSNVSAITVTTGCGECVWTDNSGNIYYVGKVGINTSTYPGDYELVVNGEIRAKEVIVETGWADYVFDKGYKLKPLHEVESYIYLNKHLPEIPSANEVEKNGVSLGEMNMLLLKKVEELTLYIINQQKEIELLKKKVNKK